MPVDTRYLRSEIDRMKRAVRNSEELQRELRELITMSTIQAHKKARQDELTRQENTTANLKFHIKELEDKLKP